MNVDPKSILWASAVLACAGLAPTASAADGAIALEPSPPPLYRPLALAVEAGTTGFGGSVSWRFASHWGVRAGGDYLSYTEPNLEIENFHYNAKVKLLSEPLTLDIYPWKNSSFHISAGLMFNQNKVTGTANASGTITIAGETFPVASVGTLNLKMEQELVNPYLGIGGNFFYFDRAHRWAMGGELGLAYTGEPDASLTRSGPAAPLVDQAVSRAQRTLQDNANHYKWWPVLKLASGSPV